MSQDSEIERLEAFVSKLLDKFSTLQAEKKDLAALLEKREATIAGLEGDLLALKDEKGEVGNRVSSLIEKIEEWETGLNDSSVAGNTDVPGSEDVAVEEIQDGSVQGNLFSSHSREGTDKIE